MDLMFRDESSHVIRKATKARRAKSRSPNPVAASLGIVPAVTITADASSVGSASPDQPNRAFSARSSPLPSPNADSLTLLTPTSSHWPYLGRGERESSLSSLDDDGDDDDPVNFPSPDDGTWPQPPSAALLYALAPSLEQQGIAYFFAQYVTADETSKGQPFDFIFQLWRPARSLADRQNDSVMAAMAAVGLAGLSGLKNCPDTMEWSRRSYGTALGLTNKALQDPNEAVKDTTMLSVLVLSMYEMMTDRDPQTVQAWQKHVNGAAVLARMRGTGQFTSRAGVRMFNMLAQIVLISCVQRGLPMPSALADLQRELENLQPRGDGDPGWNLSAPIYRVLQLRHDVKEQLLTDTDEIIGQLLDADRELSDLASVSLAPDTSGYKVVRVSRRSSIVFGDYCHVYASPAQATAWNDLRSIRMLVHETIIEAVLKEYRLSCGILSNQRRALLSRSVRLLERLRDAILATVPQYLGHIKSKDVRNTNHWTLGADAIVATVEARKPPTQLASSPRSATSLPSSTSSSIAGSPESAWDAVFSGSSPDIHGGAAAERVMTLASASNTVVWPLYLVGVSSSSTSEVRDYVVARLGDIYRDTGLVQAHTVASMVGAREISVPWAGLVYDHAAQLNIGDERT